jgi:DNA-binding transcriptional regulator of glucitol operon
VSPFYIYLLVAVVGGWMLQLYFTYRQSMTFMAQVRKLRQAGTVSIGIGGKRYRGGRAYVAIAVKDGVVQDALTLSGWTTFARPRHLPDLIDWKVSQVKGDREIPGLSTQQRVAARQAADLLKREGSPTPTTTSP